MVLAALCVGPGQVLSPEQLAEAVWGAHPPASWAKNLQGCVSRLRKQLGPDAIRTSAQGYRLTAEAGEVDAQEFVRLVRRVRQLLALGEKERALFTATQALGLWRGRPFAELEEWEPGAVEASRLGELFLELEELHLEAAVRAGHHREALSEAQAMVDAAPLRERRWILLAQVQYQSGRQADALRTLRRLRAVLSAELGLDPGPEIARLEQAILRQDPALMVPEAAQATTTECPYLGLAAYGEADADGFFGRDHETEVCLSRLKATSLLAVVGPSGSGKSSLVRAAMAGLRRQGSDVTVITPGARPLEALAAWGSRSSALVVDQVEEVFALCEDPEERGDFLAALVEHASIAPVVVALRADRMGDLAGYPAFAKLVERGLFLLGAMSEDDLRTAIEGPARQAGLLVEPGLVDLLVREVEGEPGALPLLSHALRETWLRREGRNLTVAGYQASGGIRGAVAQSAEDVYARLGPDQRHLLRDLLLRLVTPGAEGEPVRVRMPRRQVIVDPTQDALVDVLAALRLITSDDGVIALAHESLARAWPRLKGWLEDDLEGQRILHHLAASADAWDQLGRPDSELYRGVRLTQALGWWQESKPELTATERDFLDAGITAAALERRSAEDRAREQARLIRRLRGVLAGAVALLVVAAAAGALALRQTRVAEDNATAAEARNAGARALVTDDIDTSILLAVAGARLDDSRATRANLQAALDKWPQLIGSIPYDSGEAIVGLETSPDGEQLASFDRSGRIQLVDSATGDDRRTFEPGAAPRPLSTAVTAPMAYRPDGRVLAVGMPPLSSEPLVMLDPASLELLPTRFPGLPEGPTRTADVDYSADGHTLAAVFVNYSGGQAPEVTGTSLRVWDVTTKRPVLRLAEPLGRSTDTLLVELSPDGGTVYTRPYLRAYDVDTGDRLYEVRDEQASGKFLDLSPDGRLLAVTTFRPVALRLLDARTGVLVRELTGQTERVSAVQFSHDSTRLAATSQDRTAVVYDSRTGEVQRRLQLGEGNVQAVAFSPDDATLYTGGREAIRLWDLRGDRSFVARIVPPDDEPGAPEMAPGGRYTSGYGDGGLIRFTDVVTGGRSGYLTGSAQFGGDWNTIGDRFVSVGEEFVRIWDPSGPTVVRERKFPGETFNDARFSPDGARIVLSKSIGEISMIDTETLKPVGTTVRLEEPVGGVLLGSDNRSAFLLAPPPYVLGASFDQPTGGWVVVDLETGSLRRRGHAELDGGISWLAGSPDGRRVALGGGTGEVAIVDLDSGKPVAPATKGHTAGVGWLAFSADGSRLATSDGGSASLWNADTGELLGTVTLPETNSASPEFGDDGHTVYIASVMDAVYRWDTRPEHALDFACRLAGRGFTEVEWAEQFGDLPYLHTC